MERFLKVLIVDDSEDDALLLVRELRKGGLRCEFERVESAVGLKSSLNRQLWDLVVTDHNMPAFGSSEALKITKAMQPETPVIVVSGAISDDVAVDSMKSGAQDYIMKDNLARLVPVVERELRESEQRSAHRAVERKAAYLANHDVLTDLINREQFKVHLGHALESAFEQGVEHALIYVDLDQFKIINDTCGHVAGDELLKQIGNVVKVILGEKDYISRMGGDEFGILLLDCTLNEATAMAGRIHEAIKQHRFLWDGQEFRVSSCIGLVQINRASSTIEELLASADMACYAAKDKGRSYIQIYDLNDQDLTQRRDQMHWASRIRQALDRDEFVLYKQAIVGLSESASHCEFLVRMKDGERIVPPGLFIPAAERFNLMTLIDRWVVNHAFAYVKRCVSKGTSLPGGLYFINLSGSSLNDETFFDFVRERKDFYGIPPHSICFEITETTAISNIETVSVFIAEIRDLGFLFALDDFGVGMSSFAYLKAIPIDVLKIDGGFVRNIVNDAMDLAIVSACNSIAHSAGLKTVAEFVEDQAIVECLRKLGVDYAQGYGIEKPRPLDD
ncbi:EAL domain-containing protein [Ketobacter sp.]|uniref:EAL domain-containing protein n=1 Tax=Ketobacter sp. TaxID=2083498 RepID=UPI0025BD0CE2|nr:EAL domain-containing protein [Ketobacter sp.]